MTRIGVVGAGRVGAVLAAALRASGHEIVSAAGESTASRDRIAALLPGVPGGKPTDVARNCDLLLLTVPDDMLENVVTTLVGAGAIRAVAVCARGHVELPPRQGVSCVLSTRCAGGDQCTSEDDRDRKTATQGNSRRVIQLDRESLGRGPRCD